MQMQFPKNGGGGDPHASGVANMLLAALAGAWLFAADRVENSSLEADCEGAECIRNIYNYFAACNSIEDYDPPNIDDRENFFRVQAELYGRLMSARDRIVHEQGIVGPYETDESIQYPEGSYTIQRQDCYFQRWDLVIKVSQHRFPNHWDRIQNFARRLKGSLRIFSKALDEDLQRRHAKLSRSMMLEWVGRQQRRSRMTRQPDGNSSPVTPIEMMPTRRDGG